ncbi:5-methyltetrahydropteroyltriglutamate--homocysteine methyltransferase [Pseudomonas sp. EpS/L25]|uniref:5-methyltetrahydropteroyltriglutamate-- homocysteine methyltransferase n=1 Tax=Pseudomonas sp. EpS/L25 TaxID=1749078 RepID=UPI0007440811|nr:5-methyltetrahydropteroyltriglutamate--homocysteine methyltransferase [Pseudomonas sp. EpS/L25]KUM44292.1 5-methyltetrahydropteroyltriglutamate--homocysteine methyltransferase [Pseudomonas sp. EpS/L25]
MVRLHSQGSAWFERDGEGALATRPHPGRSLADPVAAGRQQRQRAWRAQQAAGIELIGVADVGWGDRVLAHSYLVGQVAGGEALEEASQVRQARAPWFSGELTYRIPEFSRDQAFALGWDQLFVEVAEARALGLAVKPAILGPLSYLWLGQALDSAFDRLELLERLLPVYGEIFARLAAQGVEWVHIDEPLLSLELPLAWRTAFERAYNLLQREPLKKLLAVRGGELSDNLGLATGLPVEGLHVDWPTTVQAQQGLLDRLPAYKTLSLGLIEQHDADTRAGERRLQFARQAGERLKERLWLAPDQAWSTTAEAAFGELVRAARTAAEAKPAVAGNEDRSWSAIEAALAKLGAQAGLASH